MPADNSRHIVDTARRRSEYTRAKAIQALRTLDLAGELVTFETVTKRAGVSRSWLYAQPDLREEIERLRAARRRGPGSPVPARQRTSDASLLQRLEAANARIRRLTEENNFASNSPAHSANNAPLRLAPARPGQARAIRCRRADDCAQTGTSERARFWGPARG
ncbi:DUF6262 family protein [Kitasatospora sp. NPDC057965]|uniref:DUF6262 family protein n=1 Tax=Kitasatospora sp. NPDC057965 TaxID=3346291 RepID=UPI0036D9CB85